jgi:excisionase family DNA binding protein
VSGERVDLATRLGLTMAEAARSLGVSERHLRSVLPDLPHVHLGRRVVIPVDGLREWLKQKTEIERGQVDRAVDEVLADLANE